MNVSRHIHYLTLITVSAWIFTILSMLYEQLTELLFYLSIGFIIIWIIDSLYHTRRIRKVLKRIAGEIL